MAVTWAASAVKHGIPREDAIHAIANAYYVESEFDEPRPEGRVRPTLYSGRRVNWAANCWRSWWR